MELRSRILVLVTLLAASSVVAGQAVAAGTPPALRSSARSTRRHGHERRPGHHIKHAQLHRRGSEMMDGLAIRMPHWTPPPHRPFPPPPRRPVAPPPAPAPASIGPFSVVAPFPSQVRLFAPTSIWNAPLAANAPLAPNSAQLASALSSEVSREIGNRTGPWINTNTYSVPVYTVGAKVPTVHVTLDGYNPVLQQEYDAVPMPAGAHSAGGSDQSVVIYQPSSDTLWEFWLASRQADGWHARWGGEMTHVSTNPGYFPGSYGASGTSLALLGGLMTIHELQAGEIDHALAIAIPNTAAGTFTPPAQRSDGTTTGTQAIPEGTHFRIDPSLNLATLHLSPLGLAMARAAQRYGIVVRDTSSCVVFFGEDPTTAAGDPYASIFGGQYPSVLLQGFPWDHLQVVAPAAGS